MAWTYMDAISAITSVCARTPTKTTGYAVIIPVGPPLNKEGWIPLRPHQYHSPNEDAVSYRRTPSQDSTALKSILKPIGNWGLCNLLNAVLKPKTESKLKFLCYYQNYLFEKTYRSYLELLFLAKTRNVRLVARFAR